MIGARSDFLINLLGDIGALAHWQTADVEQAAQWLERLGPFIGDVMSQPPEGEATGVPALLRRALEQLAPRLQAQDRALWLHAGCRYWWSSLRVYSADLLEYALQLGIRLRIPASEQNARILFRIGRSAAYDPQHLMQDDRFAPALRHQVARELGDAHFEAAVQGKPTYAQLRHRALAALIDRIEQGGGLESVEAAVQTLLERAQPGMFEEFPDLRDRLHAVQLAPALQRSLRVGLIDEFTWPAFERVLAEAARSQPNDLHLEGSAYYPVVRFGRTAVVFHGAEELRRYDLPPTFEMVHGLFYLAPDPKQPMAGDLWVSCHVAQQRSAQQVWLGQPQHLLSGFFTFYGIPNDLPLGDGRVLYDSEGVRIGDVLSASATAHHSQIASDGTQLYRFKEGSEGDLRCDILDPLTLKRTAPGWPAPMRGVIAQEDGRILKAASLRPAPQGAENSPLGQREGLVGGWWRVPKDRASEQRAVYTRVDGQTYLGEFRGGSVLIQMPASTQLMELRPAQTHSTDQFERALFLDAQGEVVVRFGTFRIGPSVDLTPSSDLPSMGFRVLPRHQWLHFLRPRDLQLSAQLRTISVEDAAYILAAAAEDHPHFTVSPEAVGQRIDLLPKTSAAQDWPHTCAAIEARLGAGDATLIGGIAQLAAKMRELELRLQTLAPVAGQDEAAARSYTFCESNRALFEGLPADPGYHAYEPNFYRDVSHILQYVSGQIAADEAQISEDRQPWIYFADALPLSMAFSMLRAEAPEEARQRWRDFLAYFLEHCALSSNTRAHVGQWRTPVEGGLFSEAMRNGQHQLLQLADGRPAYVYVIFLEECEVTNQRFYVFEALVLGDEPPLFSAPVAVFRTPERYEIADQRDLLSGVLDLYDARGPVDATLLTTAQAQTLIEGTTLSAAGLRWLWAGLPHFQGWEHDFLGAELREKLDIKTAEAAQIKVLFKVRGRARNVRLFAQLMQAARPEDLWNEAGFGVWRTALLEHWGQTGAGSLTELSALCAEYTTTHTDLQTLLQALIDFDASFFTPERLFLPVMLSIDGLRTVSPQFVRDLVALLGILPNILPAGHAALRHFAAIVAQVRGHLQPDDLVDLGTVYLAERAQRETIFERLPGPVRTVPHGVGLRGGAGLRYREADGVVVLQMASGYLEVYLRARALDCIQSWAQAIALFEAGLLPLEENTKLIDVRFFFGPDARADQVLARLATTPVPAGQMEVNPLYSVPELVAQGAARYGVSADAAALYLLTLVHPEPKKKTVLELMGWKNKAYQAACDALVRAQLLVEAKRAKAGRAHFLPGAWDARQVNEDWKLTLYQLAGRPPYQQLWHVLFERAWARVEAGDAPRFEAVPS